MYWRVHTPQGSDPSWLSPLSSAGPAHSGSPGTMLAGGCWSLVAGHKTEGPFNNPHSQNNGNTHVYRERNPKSSSSTKCQKHSDLLEYSPTGLDPSVY